MNSPLFITFEGGEGSGKSTQMKLLTESLQKAGHTITTTREPGGTHLGAEIRRLLLSEKSAQLDPKTELLLYTADRCQHVQEVLRPALKKGHIVVCDRYQDSTTVYQGMARGLDSHWIQMCSELATGGLNPDLTFLLDLPPELGLKRSQHRLKTEAKDEGRFEQEDLEFHKKVREGFLNLAKQEPERFHVIEATQKIEVIHEEILEIVKYKISD